MQGLTAPLFVPATRPDRFAKAAASGADAVIVDLEDAVAPDDKVTARNNLAAALGLPAPMILRINARETIWYEADIRAASTFGITHLCVPKVETLDVLDELCAVLGDDIQIMAQIETARGAANAAAIADHYAVSQLAFGPADFFLNMGMRASPAMTQYVLCDLAVASRAADIALPLDGPCFAIAEAATLANECILAVASGAGGKLCIHPSQPHAVRAEFGPHPEEIEWARRVLATDGDGSARTVDGRMVDAPVIASARAVLGRTHEPPHQEPEIHQGV